MVAVNPDKVVRVLASLARKKMEKACPEAVAEDLARVVRVKVTVKAVQVVRVKATAP